MVQFMLNLTFLFYFPSITNSTAIILAKHRCGIAKAPGGILYCKACSIDSFTLADISFQITHIRANDRTFCISPLT